MRSPDYTQLLKVLAVGAPDRPTLFEFFLNGPLYQRLNRGDAPVRGDGLDGARVNMYAYRNAGYDYTTGYVSAFNFPKAPHAQLSTLSLNDGFVITDWASYEAYQWPEPEHFDDTGLDTLARDLPEGMRFVVAGPCGVLENVIQMVGYDNLCVMLYDEPDLAQQIFDGVGSRLLRYYEAAAQKDSVCALISNDDWGFKTQTMLSPADMRRYVFPWHKRIVEAGHRYGKPSLLHSCGNLSEVMEDIITDMRFDGKHSFEDAILPIEDAYERYAGRIALLGGLDVHFICTQPPEKVAERARAMLQRAQTRGGYALGTGNSVPEYVPQEGYLAMIGAICDA